ncbi:Holliday junction DNA helicase RuvA [Dyadobacter sp. BE34]|jgi:Holliday junction DNA helicase RuvA|uniref:Holliday junction branch migration complex subunit RuvA n=1 Tax=Dyadobacter fermentans TaxID=94254 RepID=A0ABU1QQK3_9BACT|nr:MULTISPECIES: Holliday junction branch migration protein RuvA [Dyadobacter]MBZ1358747.1 Holliday junction branch migration protein RuvA [Dyadobacter fermentans]MDR6803421.1 Holliday junction DNA helicase RuvA [Dyadobacter fermentans]MDR7041162.1 Holliday junction DNA helicase RuvA [Dyadobacter sp. BE242]MDR7195565.1 Holliday junction DNA helicase RuvA [Dyadobacter sp. BE34]MDR7213890.1 Holliday junction DNA helicase RuvA [Dyadobacter sp. BE31]
MIAYVNGIVTYKDPAYAIIDVNGVGYEVRISLQTYTSLPDIGARCKLVTFLNIREDAHVLYGFWGNDEKKLFLDLTSISGIGPSTALVMLSSLSSSEIRQGIIDEDLRLIQSIKGIGSKTAQRVILELRDKIRKEELVSTGTKSAETSSSTLRSEALAALVTLGIPKPTAEKSLDAIIKREGQSISVENLIKLALR